MFAYIIAAVIIAVVITTIIFVVVGAVERHKKVNLNWLLLMATIILGCTLAMVLIYHSQHDLTAEDIQNSYNEGYEDGVASASHTIPNNDEMEEWFSSTQEVIVGENEGGDTAVHIIDHNGDEWVLYADSTQTK